MVKILNPPSPLFQRGNNPFSIDKENSSIIHFIKGTGSISPFNKGGKGGFKTLLFIFWFLICLAFIGCGANDLFDTQDSVPIEKPNSLKAIDLPSAEGDSWEYATPDGQSSYTAKIAGTKNIGGYTARIMKTDAETPVDFTGAGYGFPVRDYLFTKDSDNYTEYGFDLWVDFLNDTYFQRYIPKRIAWSFPLYEGKEWIVSTLYTEPKFTYTRKVISANETVTVPTGTYAGIFRIEESVSSDTQQNSGLISIYWLAKDVGVIKYQYIDSTSSNPITYELRKFNKG
jgi:hypothetical protein